MTVNLGPSGQSPVANPPLPGAGELPAEKADAGKQTEGVQAQAGAEAPKKPTVSFDGDSVGGAGTSDVDTSGLGEPTLPDTETTLPDAEKYDQEAVVAGVLATLQEIFGRGFTLDTLAQVLRRADELDAHPDQAIFTELLGPNFPNELAAYLQQALPQGFSALPNREAATDILGPDGAALLERFNTEALDFVAATVFGGEGPLLGLTEEQLTFGGQLLQTILSQVVATGGLVITEETINGISTLAPAGLRSSTLSFKDGKLCTSNVSPGTAAIIGKLASIVEGGYEALIGMATLLQANDQKSRLDGLQQALAALKQQKLGLLKQINTKMAEIAGKELGGAIQAQKAEKAAKCAKTWGFVKAIVLIVVAVVVLVIAIVGTPFSGGASLALIAGVAAIVSAAITLIQQIPAMLQMIAALLDALGASGVAGDLERAAADIQKALSNKYVAGVLIAIQVVCAVCSFGIGLYSAGAGMLDSALKIVNTCVQVGAGIAQVAISIGAYSAQKDLIAALNAVEQLKGQLALIETAIKAVMIEIERVEKSEDRQQEMAQHGDELNEQLMERLQTMADACGKSAAAIAAN